MPYRLSLSSCITFFTHLNWQCVNLSGSGIGWGSSVSDPFLKKAGEELLNKSSAIGKLLVCIAGQGFSNLTGTSVMGNRNKEINICAIVLSWRNYVNMDFHFSEAGLWIYCLLQSIQIFFLLLESCWKVEQLLNAISSRGGFSQEERRQCILGVGSSFN